MLVIENLAALQVVAMQPGCFAAVLQLTSMAACDVEFVEIHPHLPDKSVPLWVASGSSRPGMWTALSATATRALAYFKARAQASDARFPGAMQPVVLYTHSAKH